MTVWGDNSRVGVITQFPSNVLQRANDSSIKSTEAGAGPSTIRLLKVGNLELRELALIEHGAGFWSQCQQLGQNNLRDLHLIQQLDKLLNRWLCFC
jgi:hypothetical protein